LYPISLEYAEKLVLRRSGGFFAWRDYKLLPGDGIALLYPSVGANRHLGTVTEVTTTSISVHIDGLLRPKQFFFSRKRHWFSGGL
jgi:hypothetical protein